MATIIRSNVTLSAPLPGSMLLPPLRISGIRHRWHAETVSGTPGSAVTGIADSIGTQHLNTVTGQAALRETPSGRRYIDLSGGSAALNRVYRPAAGSLESNEEFTLAGLVYWEAAQGGAYGILNTSSTPSLQGVSLDAQNNRIAAYGGSGGTVLYTAPSSRQGWHTVVVSYRKAGQESVSLDGGAISRGETHVSTPLPIDSFGVSGRPDCKVRIVDFAHVDHALTDAEHVALHESLAAQIPG